MNVSSSLVAVLITCSVDWEEANSKKKASGTILPQASTNSDCRYVVRIFPIPTQYIRYFHNGHHYQPRDITIKAVFLHKEVHFVEFVMR